MQRRWTSAAAAITALALVMGACGGAGTGGTTGASTAKTVKIISSLPMTGASRTQTVEIVNSIKMAIDETKITNVTVLYDALDDATAAKGSWDAAQEAENARKAINDKQVVAYIGTYNSGAAKVSIPLLNQAGMVMVSPANTYPGLTKGPEKGAEPDEPGKYYPNGKRNYARVVPADDIQGAVGATWAQELGAKKVYIVHDTELYGKGIADVFRAKAKALGLTEAGYEGAQKADNYRALANKIKDAGADLVYYGGIVDNNPAVLLKDLRSLPITVRRQPQVGRHAIYEYNARHAGEPSFRRVNEKTDPSLLARIAVNYIRHHLTDYEKLYKSLDGLPFRQRETAYHMVYARVGEAISRVYPALAAEVHKQARAKGIDLRAAA